MFITNAVLENGPQNRHNFIFLDPFLCNFLRPKTWDKMSVNIDHAKGGVYCISMYLFRDG